MSRLHKTLFPICHIPLKRMLKICATMVLVALILVLCVIFFDVGVPSELRRNSNLTSEQMEMKTILYWSGMFNSETFYLGEGEIFRSCKISACRATHHRNFMEIQDFDALLFHAYDTKVTDIPPVRSTKQKYIFVTLETPSNYGLDAHYLPDEFFNWTMTYRRDSDIPQPYGYIIDSVTNEVAYPLWARTTPLASDTVYESLRSAGTSEKFEGKKKTAAWFVSHCRTTGRRDRYVDELRKFIDIDIYGKCGPLYCKSGSEKCYKMLKDNYYFYIAFENSLCQDYVTEKLFKAMSHDVVPIVYGGVNYSEFIPPGSYINIADFKSPQHLAKHLKYLIDTPEEYGKFFWWKKHFFVDLSQRATLCKMCELLHDEKKLASYNISDVKKWWTKGQCQDPIKFLEKIMPQ